MGTIWYYSLVINGMLTRSTEYWPAPIWTSCVDVEQWSQFTAAPDSARHWAACVGRGDGPWFVADVAHLPRTKKRPILVSMMWFNHIYSFQLLWDPWRNVSFNELCNMFRQKSRPQGVAKKKCDVSCTFRGAIVTTRMEYDVGANTSKQRGCDMIVIGHDRSENHHIHWCRTISQPFDTCCCVWSDRPIESWSSLFTMTTVNYHH